MDNFIVNFDDILKGEKMSFKRYSSYIQEKKQLQPVISIDLDVYKEHIFTNLSGLVIKNDVENLNVLKKIVNISNIRKKLYDLNYPYVEAFVISLKNGNPSGIYRNLDRLKQYENSEKIVAMVESSFWNYQAKVLSTRLTSEDVDHIIDSLISESTICIREIISKIELILEKIDWDNHPIKIQALIPQNDWVVESVKVFVGGLIPSNFILKKTIKGFDIVEENIDGSNKIKNQIINFIEKLRENPNYKQIVTLYMSQPKDKRQLFETKKRDIALGIKTILSQGTYLTNIPYYENTDLWKIKVDNKNLFKTLHEGDFIGYELLDDTEIRWIEILKEGETNEEQHK